MTFVGLSLGEQHDRGGAIVMSFGILPGLESEAGLDVLAYLADGLEVALENDLDEGHEGVTSFRRTRSGLVTQIGGHGWQSGWKPTDDAGVLATVIELAVLNRGDEGRLIRHKRGE